MKKIRILAILLAALLLLAGCQQSAEEEEPAPNPVATFTMSDGKQMRFVLRPDMAPNTVANFITLANKGYYDGQRFFRVVSGAFIQAGDPHNDGTGDPVYAIKGEFSANGFKQNTLSHVRGTLSMSRQSGYDTAGSQFFILHYSYPEYDGKYAAFGTIQDEDSLAVLDALATQPVDGSFRPLTAEVIASIRVETYEAEYEPVTLDRK